MLPIFPSTIKKVVIKNPNFFYNGLLSLEAISFYTGALDKAYFAVPRILDETLTFNTSSLFWDSSFFHNWPIRT